MARIPLSDVPETGSRIVELDGKCVLLCRGPSGIRGDEIWPHQLLSLDDDRVRDNFTICPHHGESRGSSGTSWSSTFELS